MCRMQDKIYVELVIDGKRYCYDTEIDRITKEGLFTSVDFCTDPKMRYLIGMDYHQIDRILEKRKTTIDSISQDIARALQDFIGKRDTIDGYREGEL